MKKIIICIFLCCSLIFSEELNLNIRNNFNNTIYKYTNIEIKYENNMPLYYIIKKNKFEITPDTDLYLSFDSDLTKESKNYNVIYKNYYISENKSFFDKSAYFSGADKRIELVGNQNSFFQSGTILDSFTVSFWVYPITFSNNEVILRIGSQYFNTELNTVEDQSIYAKMMDGRVNFEFINIFSSSKIKKNTLSLGSYNRLIPEKWHHINLSYDAYKGIIKLYINGNEDSILVASEDGTLYSSVLNLKFNKANRCVLSLAPSFFGSLDEFCIIKKAAINNYNFYSLNNAEIISNLYDFGIGGIYLDSITAKDEKEKNSDIYYYYRYSNEPFDKNDQISKNIKWNLLDKNFVPIKARFIQWKAVLLIGDNSNYSPKFKGIVFNYRQDTPPNKPANLKIISTNGSVILKWDFNSEKDIKGYKVYYGVKSRYYFGNEAKEGVSPIDNGLKNNITLNGLDINKIYYFSITAYDDNNHEHESDFSDEISIRPYISE